MLPRTYLRRTILPFVRSYFRVFQQPAKSAGLLAGLAGALKIAQLLYEVYRSITAEREKAKIAGVAHESVDSTGKALRSKLTKEQQFDLDERVNAARSTAANEFKKLPKNEQDLLGDIKQAQDDAERKVYSEYIRKLNDDAKETATGSAHIADATNQTSQALQKIQQSVTATADSVAGASGSGENASTPKENGKSNSPSFDQPTLAEFDAGLALSTKRAATELEVEKTKNKNKLEGDKAAFEAQKLELEKYLAQRLELVEKNFLAEQNFIKEQRHNLNLSLNVATKTEDQSKIKQQLEDVNLREQTLKIQRDAEVDKISRDKDAELKKRQEKSFQVELNNLKAFREQAEINRSIDQNNFRLTDSEKRAHALKSYQVELEEIDKELNKVIEKQKGLLEGPELDKLKETQGSLESQKRTVTGQQDKTLIQPNPDSLGDQLLSKFGEMQRKAGTVSEQIANGFTNVIGSAITTVSDSLTKVILGTQSWGDALKTIGSSLLSTFVRTFIEIPIRYAAMKLAMFVIDKLFGDKAGEAGSEQAAQASAAWAPGAVSASIASYGVAAGTGLAAFIAAQAIGAGVSSAISFAAAEGGIVPGAPSSRDNRIAAVATGEYIVRSAAVSHYGPELFEALNTFQVPRNSLDNFRLPAPRSASRLAFADGGLVGPLAGNPGAASTVNVAPADVQIAVLNNTDALRQWMQSREGRKMVVDIVSGAKSEIGIRS